MTTTRHIICAVTPMAVPAGTRPSGMTISTTFFTCSSQEKPTAITPITAMILRNAWGAVWPKAMLTREKHQHFVMVHRVESPAVTFRRRASFRSWEAQARIPDPNDLLTFLASKLDWVSLEQQSHREWLRFYRQLLICRREKIVPQIEGIVPGVATYDVLGPSAVHIRWRLAKGGSFELVANLGQNSMVLRKKPDGQLLYTTDANYTPSLEQARPFSAQW